MGAARLGRWLGRWQTQRRSARYDARARVSRARSSPLCRAAGRRRRPQRLYGYLPGSGNYRRYSVTDHHRRAAGDHRPDPAGRQGLGARSAQPPRERARDGLHLPARGRCRHRAARRDRLGLAAAPQRPQAQRRRAPGRRLRRGRGRRRLSAADARRHGQELPARLLHGVAAPPTHAPPQRQLHVDFAATSCACSTTPVTRDRYGELVVNSTGRRCTRSTETCTSTSAYLDQTATRCMTALYYPPAALYGILRRCGRQVRPYSCRPCPGRSTPTNLRWLSGVYAQAKTAGQTARACR